MISPRYVVLSAVAAACSFGAIEHTSLTTPPYVAPSHCVSPEQDILTRLRQIPSFKRVIPLERRGAYKVFALDVVQPVDHSEPEGATFTQRAYLMHRAVDAPTVLLTTGYEIHRGWGKRHALIEATRMLDANQVVMGHRFFEGARPRREELDWDKLTVEQAAADSHKVVQALKPIYTKSWMGTGWSKGGMTSIFHKRAYPDDLDLIVPMVAPISQGIADPRYAHFLKQIGTKSCRKRLDAVIIGSLERLDELVDALPYRPGRRAFWRAVLKQVIVGSPWVFWQYDGIDSCRSIPNPERAEAREILEFFGFVSSEDLARHASSLEGSIDQLYTIYAFQALRQLGSPNYFATGYLERLQSLGHLDDVEVKRHNQRMRTLDVIDPPWNFLPAHDPTKMRDVSRWLRTEARDVVAIYGEYDPWTAGKVTLNEELGSKVYIAPASPHATMLIDLAPKDYDQVRARILRLRPANWQAPEVSVSQADRDALWQMIRDKKL